MPKSKASADRPPAADPRAAARRPARDRDLPGDDRAAPGRPREERQRAQRRRRRRRASSRSSRSAAPSRRRSPTRPSSTRSARSPRSPRSSSSRTARSGRSSRARGACGSTASPRRARTCSPASRSCPDVAPTGVEVEALMKTVQGQIEQYVQSGAPGPARGGRGRPQHHRAGPPGRHGRLQPGHDHGAAPGAARDRRRRRAPQALLRLPRPPGRGPRAQGEDPERGQVRDGQDPAGVHPPRAAQGDPARAGRGRPPAGRDPRAAREGRVVRDARGGAHPRPQGGRPDEPDPLRLPGGGRDPDLRGLAGRPAVEHLDDRQPRHPGGRQDPRRRITTASRRSRSGSSSTSRSGPSRTRSAARSSASSDRPASARRRSARASPGPWAASSCG